MLRFNLFLCAVLVHTAVFAQEEDYYKSIDKRKLSYEVVNLPNLDSKFTSFYASISGAFRNSWINKSANFETFGSNNKALNEWLELNLGLNFNNDYFIETGVVQLKNHLSTTVYSAMSYPGFAIGVRNKQWYIPVGFKKKIFTLNRVTKNANFNVGAATAFKIFTEGESPIHQTFDYQNFIKSRDLEYFNVTLNQAQRLIYTEVNAEVKGNVTDRLELIIFVKGVYFQPKHLSINFNVNYSNGRHHEEYSIFERGGSVVFGLQIRVNSKKYYKYSSKI